MRLPLAAAALLLPLAASAAEVELRFAPGSLGSAVDAEREIRRVLRSAPAEGLQVGGAEARLTTSEAGLAALQSDSRFHSVVRLDRAAPAAAAGWTLWRLTVTSKGATVDIAAQRLPGVAAAQEPRPPGPGRIAIVARDASGAEIARTTADDPRLVRYEGVDAQGRFIERRDLLIAPGGDITVALPDDPRIKRIEIEDQGAALGAVAVE